MNSEQVQTVLERMEAEAQRGSSAAHEVWLYMRQSSQKHIKRISNSHSRGGVLSLSGSGPTGPDTRRSVSMSFGFWQAAGRVGAVGVAHGERQPPADLVGCAQAGAELVGQGEQLPAVGGRI